MKATIAKQWLLGIGICLSMVSCDSDRVFERNDDFENRIWAAEDTHTFLFTIDDAQTDYEVSLNVRNSLIYPYQNLYTTISIEDSTGTEIYQTLKNTSLFDEKTGEPLGSGLGDIFDHQSVVVSGLRFPHTGTYTAFVTQAMRMDSLPEIMSVGIRVAKMEK
ncbi:gliding motility lipoprotein GldH [Cytophagales bacterium LB-30]|uniref:Gliding motility lipoprotein GldH n=1 Tax=Shiella aurantiaca TaxID=3058365 RepID=A0ABT8F864_9BACT|nr:gliding motility lipoprotein GldH [Shiella aurantiaca]MDN4166406.1 gliding motility lipoprotein GldH [Shiella aurantiaca]